MTGIQLSVKLDDLNSLVGKLSTVSTHLGQATSRMSSLSSDQAGDLHGALDSYASHWSYGLGQIKKSVDSLHDTLAKTTKTYGDNETATSALFAKGAQ